jgi:CheY-like chemotaxis protein
MSGNLGNEEQRFPQILVADDSPLQLKALCARLRSNGYDVAEAGCGHHVVRHLKSCSVDLLLLDLSMPDGDGFEVLSYIQEHRPTLPVIILSALSADDIQIGMRRLPEPRLPMLLQKPIDPEQLIRLVELQLSAELSEPV